MSNNLIVFLLMEIIDDNYEDRVQAECGFAYLQKLS